MSFFVTSSLAEKELELIAKEAALNEKEKSVAGLARARRKTSKDDQLDDAKKDAAQIDLLKAELGSFLTRIDSPTRTLRTCNTTLFDFSMFLCLPHAYDARDPHPPPPRNCIRASNKTDGSHASGAGQGD